MYYYCVAYNVTVILCLFLVIITIHPCGQASRTKQANDASCPNECQCRFSGYRSSSAKCHLHQQSLSTILYNLSSTIHILELNSNRITDAQIQEYNDISIKNDSHGAQNLHSLDLSFNQIQRISMNSFSSLQYLEHLSLKANHISTIENMAFANLHTLQMLDLSWNFIDSLNNKTLLGLDSLNDLNLSINAIFNISGQPFIRTGNLKILDLNHNLIQSISRMTFTGLYHLKTLLLRNNHITRIDTESFVHLTSVVHLDLSLNRISKLSALTFWGCQRLTNLNLSYSGVTLIERRAFLGLDSLRSLTLEGNLIHRLDNGAFLGLQQLQMLSLYNMPNLRILSEGALFGMPMLEKFYLNNNHRLSFLPKFMLLKFSHLTHFDASNNSLTTIVESTFQNASMRLEHIYLSGNPYVCDCWMIWLTNVYYVQDRPCISLSNNSIPTVIDHVNNSSNYQIHNTSCIPVSDYDAIVCQLPWLPTNNSVYKLSELTSTDLRCERPQLTSNNSVQQTHREFHKIGSSVYLYCNVSREPEPEIMWILPNRRRILTYHRYHPDTVEHLPGASDVLMPSGSFHTQHHWHSKRRYKNDHDNNRVTLLKDGTLYIDYMLRTDVGRYTCTARTPMGNVSMTTVIRLDYDTLKEIKWISLLIGWSSAFTFFFLALVITLITNLATRCINQRKRQTIKTLFDNIDAYKSAQFDKIKEIGATHMGKFRDQYNYQLERLRENYNRNVIRIKENCAGQMERLRDSYITQLSRIKDYSSLQMDKVRDNYHSQMVKIREYGSTQVDKLREQYKLQQQHIIKLLETMNLENCKTILETECVRADSMLFDQAGIMLDIAADMPVLSTPSDLSTSGDSEYMTAPSGPSSHSDTSFRCHDDMLITDNAYTPHTGQSEYDPDDNTRDYTFMPSVIVSARSLPSSLNSLEPQHLHTNQLSQSEVLSNYTDLHQSHGQTPHICSSQMTDIRNLEASIDNLFSLESEISMINSDKHDHSRDTSDREIILTSADLERYLRETSV